jgi:hypothetical protein
MFRFAISDWNLTVSYVNPRLIYSREIGLSALQRYERREDDTRTLLLCHLLQVFIT